jgi:stage III sporulation protein SpoIIIAA
MGNVLDFFKVKESKFNVLLLGLPGAGKTHLLYNSQIGDENWQSKFRNQPSDSK